MKSQKQMPHVAAMILVSSIVFMNLVIAPTAGTYETSSVQPAPRPTATRIAAPPAAVPLREPKKLDRWDKFEAEFGIKPDSAPPFLAPLSELKYRVDVAIFTVHTALHSLEDLVELRYSNGRIGRSVTFNTPSPAYLRNSLLTFEDARLKFDFDIAGGKPYLGVRLVLPFGN